MRQGLYGDSSGICSANKQVQVFGTIVDERLFWRHPRGRGKRALEGRHHQFHVSRQKTA